ncbi:MAG: protein-L-isoaspartate O-methyltransferase [Sphingomicrobium sp.]|nr:protein-L-isoaspartate O-methyltransferase [Sphingomonadales bacterium]
MSEETFMPDRASMSDNAPARRAMVDSQLRPQGVTDPLVLAAMAAVPREDYVPVEARSFAYTDRSIPVEGGAMMPPAPLGRLLTAAKPQPGERALVVGAAPGYTAAVLRAIGVETVEQRAANMGAGAPKGSPFDLVVIEGAVADVPASLTNALAPGGRIVTALLTAGSVTRLAIGRKVGGIVGYTRFADSEIPELTAFARPPAFTF